MGGVPHKRYCAARGKTETLAVDLAGLCKTLRLFLAAHLVLEREQEGHSLDLRDFLMTPVETA